MNATRSTLKSLRAIRLSLGLTQLEAAKQLGISNTYLCRVERGSRVADWNILVPMARLYRVKLKTLEEIAASMKVAREGKNGRTRRTA